MLFGLDGVELGLIIVFGTLFAAILSGYPVAFGLSGAAVLSFAIIALFNELGWLLVENDAGELVPVLNYQLGLGGAATGAWQSASRTLAQWGSNTYIRAFGENQNDTLLAVPLFVLMGIALERSKIAEELLTSMGRLFGGLPGGLAVSVVAVGALLAASTGIVGATVVTMGLISLPTMLRAGYSKELSTGIIATSGTLGQVIPPSIVLVLLGSMVGDIYSKAQKGRSELLGIPLPELLGSDIAISTGTLFKAAFIPGIVLALLYAAYAMTVALLNPKAAPPIKIEVSENDYNLGADYGNSSGRVFRAVALPPILMIMALVTSGMLGWSGSQRTVENALEFASFQAHFERMQAARPGAGQNAEEFADLQAYVSLLERNKFVPSDLAARVEPLLESTSPEAIIETMRQNEFDTRKGNLVSGVSSFAVTMEAMLGLDEAAPFQSVLVKAEQAKSLDDLEVAVDGAIIGAPLQKLVIRAIADFDVAPFETALQSYLAGIKDLRKNNLRQLSDDQKAVEFIQRRAQFDLVVGPFFDLYQPFITDTKFLDTVAAARSAQNADDLVKAIRKLPNRPKKMENLVQGAENVLNASKIEGLKFAYERAVREVDAGAVSFDVGAPVDGPAANLVRLAYSDLSDDRALKEMAAYLNASIESYKVPVLSTGLAIFALVVSIMLAGAAALRPRESKLPLLIGGLGVVAFLAAGIWLVEATTAPWTRTGIYALPLALIFYGLAYAAPRLMQIEVIRVVMPPVILIVAVLGSIFGGITNPTPAAALGAGGAILLAAIKLMDRKEQVGPFNNTFGRQFLLLTAASIALMLVIKINFLDDGSLTGLGRSAAASLATFTYIIAILGLFYSIFVLLSARSPTAGPAPIMGLFGSVRSWLLSRDRLLPSVVQETAKVSVMVFAILIGSQLLALTLRSFGGEEYIEHFLRSFDDPRTLLLVVMIVLFFLGFVLDFIEIIFIVIPIVGPVIYAADPTLMPPEWITILIAVNLQTSFITPPFGFALFYLRGVAPKEVTTMHIYRGIIPFVLIQILGLIILWHFPQIVTFLPDLLPDN